LDYLLFNLSLNENKYINKQTNKIINVILCEIYKKISFRSIEKYCNINNEQATMY